METKFKTQTYESVGAVYILGMAVLNMVFAN